MRTTLRMLLVALVVAVTGSACNGDSSSSSNSAAASLKGSYAGHGSFINPIDFTVADGVVHGVHGMVSVDCVSAPSTVIEDSEFSDADSIRLTSSAAFSDDFHYLVGNGKWTLHVQGQLYSNGSAAGYLSVHGVGCYTPNDGWAAARSGVPLPPIPTSPPSSPAASCSPQPCQNQNGVTLSVQSATSVTASDSSGPGVDVAFSVANNSTSDVLIQNTFQHFQLQFGNGDVVDHSWAQFSDANGQDVPCLRSDPVTVGAGQQVTNQHICFLLPHDESGQQMSFVWGYAGPPFVIPIGALQ